MPSRPFKVDFVMQVPWSHALQMKSICKMHKVKMWHCPSLVSLCMQLKLVHFKAGCSSGSSFPQLLHLCLSIWGLFFSIGLPLWFPMQLTCDSSKSLVFILRLSSVSQEIEKPKTPQNVKFSLLVFPYVKVILITILSFPCFVKWAKMLKMPSSARQIKQVRIHLLKKKKGKQLFLLFFFFNQKSCTLWWAME